MSNTLIQITAQYYENYSANPDSPSWKAKGGQVFTLKADSDDFFYGEESCIEAIKQMLDKQSNSHCRYEYNSHELIFSEPVQLSTEEFEATLKAICQKAPQL